MKVFKGLAVTAAVMLFLFAGITGASAKEKVIRLRAQSTWAAGLPILQEAADHFAKKVGELSGGRLIVDMNPSGAIVPANELVEAVHKGVLDIGCGWASYWRGTFPAAPLFGAVECGPTALEYVSWVMTGGGLELWQEMYDSKGYNVKVLPPYSVHGCEDLAWSNKPIRRLEDFKGLRFRTGGYYWGRILQKMGASVVTLPGSEVIPSLQRGVIDAGEFSMPAIDINMGFHQVCKYLIIPGIHQPSSMDETLVNKKVWEKLPDDLKAILWAAAEQSSFWILKREMELNPPAFKKFKEAGIEIITLSPEVQGQAKKLADEIHNETAASDPFFKKVLESQRKFHETWVDYSDKFKIEYKMN